MDFGKFILLMWKNVKLRLFRCISTLLEFFIPISIVFGLAKLSTHKFADPISINATQFPVISIPSLCCNSVHMLYYTPSNTFTDTLVTQLQQHYESICSVEIFTTESVENETALEKHIIEDNSEMNINSSLKLVGLVFLNHPESIAPSTQQHLSYKIRVLGKWNTALLYLETQKPGPNLYDPYYFEKFVGVQILVDQAFMNMNGIHSSQFQVQWFPYPAVYIEVNVKQASLPIASLVIVLTTALVTPYVMSSCIEEKNSGVRELMKVAGVTEVQLWISWFIYAISIQFISYTISVIILKIPFTNDGLPTIHYIPFLILWLLITLFIIANTAFCFMLCAIFSDVSIATMFNTITYIIFFILNFYVTEKEFPILNIIFCLYSTRAFETAVRKLIKYELTGTPFTWNELTSLDNTGISVASLLFVLVFDTILYTLLAIYISNINPGKFGTRRHPLFICQGFFAKKARKEENQPTNLENDCLEPPPQNMEETIKIKNLRKSYGNVSAVQGVNLIIYGGEITALLGHNGAGKTTTLAILSGLTSATAGSIHYKDLDVLSEMDAFRKKLGFCPQENRLFPYLTVLDHLIFFGMLRGATNSAAKKEAMEYLRILDMENKANNLPPQLSGGMKRKLCLSIALMGKSEVLILDEPTSGMDIQSKRDLWNLLLELRGSRTIILTTHDMEEADALGNRIAIIDHGTIVCHGTGMFLKKLHGAGYMLSVTKIGDSSQLTNLIQKYVPESSLQKESSTEAVYKLSTNKTQFPALFKALENNKGPLGIKEMGVNCTTLTDVFVKIVGHGGVRYWPSKMGSGNTKDERSTGLFLVLRQIFALIWKKWLYTYRTLLRLTQKVVVNTFFLVLLLRAGNYLKNTPEPSLNLTLSTYPNPLVWLWRNDSSDSDFTLSDTFADYVKENGGILSVFNNSDYIEDLLEFGDRDLSAFKTKLLLGGIINNVPSSLILYNNFQYHSLPIALNTYVNSLLKSTGSSISTVNHPIFKPTEEEPCPFITNTFLYCGIWLFVLGVYTIDITNVFPSFLNMERVNGFKHIQFMSNVSPIVYWLGTVFFDFLFFLVVSSGRMVIYSLFDDHFHFLTYSEGWPALLLLFVLYGIAGLLFMYIFSFFSNSRERSDGLFFIINIFGGIITAVFHVVATVIPPDQFSWIWELIFNITKYVIWFVAPLNFFLILIKLVLIFVNNARCTYCTPAALPSCQGNLTIQTYFENPSSTNPNGILPDVLFLLVDIVVYSIILVLISYGIVARMTRFLQNFVHGEDQTETQYDEDVRKEIEDVQRMKSDGGASENVVLLVDGLQKRYGWFKVFTAVQDVSFLVKQGECFGLLGVNGAGKTTSFRILTAEVLPTKGDSAINSIKLSVDKSKYLSMAGYCAQTNCFIEELTGREMLALIATLRGMRGSSLSQTVDKWINILGLEEYQNRNCGSYSGGNKRKLCTAMAFIGDPRVVFLDEPTTGVDPVSRYKLYDVMGESRKAGQAVVLTSHSMEECESLCDRITIMAAGVMKCLGSAQHLKQRFAQGFSLIIKMSEAPVTNADHPIENVKSVVMNAFSYKCILTDQNKTQLFYEIKDTSLPWSVLFETMENIKSKHKIIDDYQLGDTTLEQVFRSFGEKSRKKYL